MKPNALALAVCFACAASMPLLAGQVYGTILSGGQPLKGADVQIQCGAETPVTGATTADGAYRLNVPQQGQCTLSLPKHEGKPSAVIFSTPNPASFNFDLVKSGDGTFELKRR